MILLVAGWLGLPGGPLYWTLGDPVPALHPEHRAVCFRFGRAILQEQQGAVGEAFSGFLQTVGVTLINLAFLPHQTLLSLDAIIRSLVRRFVTGQRLLEWETAAEAESTYGAAHPGRPLSCRYARDRRSPGRAGRPLQSSRAASVAPPILVLWGLVRASRCG